MDKNVLIFSSFVLGGISALLLGKIIKKTTSNIDVWEATTDSVRWGKDSIFVTESGNISAYLDLYKKGKIDADVVDSSSYGDYSFFTIKNIPNKTITGVIINNKTGNSECKSAIIK